MSQAIGGCRVAYKSSPVSTEVTPSQRAHVIYTMARLPEQCSLFARHTLNGDLKFHATELSASNRTVSSPDCFSDEFSEGRRASHFPTDYISINNTVVPLGNPPTKLPR